MKAPTDFKPDQARRSDRRTLVHEHGDWGSIKADFVRRTGLSRQETRLTPQQHSLLINLSGDATTGEDFVDGRKISFTPRRPGSIIFVPAHCEWRGWDEGDTNGSYLFVSIDRSLVDGTCCADHLQPIIGFRHRMVEASLQIIMAEVVNPDPISPIMVESQAIQILAHLERLNAPASDTFRGGLSAYNLRRVLSMLEDRFADPPRLDELARTAGVSRRHFIRAFKTSTGKTPHAYLLNYRLERAADLLRSTRLSATDIAFEIGFGSPSHFTSAFRKLFGVPPGAYRRCWRS